jgi:hypothetical protein
MNDIFLTSHIIMHIFFYLWQFLTNLVIFYNSKLFYHMLFYVILSYAIIGHSMLFHHWLLLVI